MRYYENLFIVNPNIEHNRLTQVIDSAKGEIIRLGGQVLFVDDWGKKRLAYPIEKHRYGNYVLIQFETENHSVIRELGNWMKLVADIIAYQTIRLDQKPEVKPAESAAE